jgi:hypothetical protein
MCFFFNIVMGAARVRHWNGARHGGWKVRSVGIARRVGGESLGLGQNGRAVCGHDVFALIDLPCVSRSMERRQLGKSGHGCVFLGSIDMVRSFRVLISTLAMVSSAGRSKVQLLRAYLHPL